MVFRAPIYSTVARKTFGERPEVPMRPKAGSVTVAAAQRARSGVIDADDDPSVLLTHADRETEKTHEDISIPGISLTG